jgi:hypothetical protein
MPDAIIPICDAVQGLCDSFESYTSNIKESFDLGSSKGRSGLPRQNGTEALYALFLDHMAKSRAASGTSSDQQAKILFAAMIGARLLAQSVGNAEWIRSLKSDMRAEAAQGRDAG